MLILLVIVLTQQFTIPVEQIACQCGDIPQEDVCNETKMCLWQENECSKLNCTQVTNQEWCDVILPNSYKCIWNKNQCTQFTKCTDYVVSEPQDCFDKWFCVDGGLTANGQYQCQDQQLIEQEEQEIICDNFKSNDDCQGDQQDGSTCVWQDEKCLNITISQCKDAPQDKYCDGMSCYWNETSQECDELNCDYFKSEDECNIYYSFDLSQVTKCMWNVTQCIDFNLIDLEPSQCLNMSLNTYVWNSIQARCVQCAFDYLVNFVYLVYVLLF